jgi:hypothetical protein
MRGGEVRALRNRDPTSKHAIFAEHPELEKLIIK